MIIFTIIIAALVYKVLAIYLYQVRRVASKFHLRSVTFLQYFLPVFMVVADIFGRLVSPIYQLYFLYKDMPDTIGDSWITVINPIF